MSRAVWRFVGRLLVSWLFAVILWCILPSPSRSSEYSPLPVYGGLTRVYEMSDFYPYMDTTPAVQMARLNWQKYMAMDFHYNHTDRSLEIGFSHDPLSRFFHGELLPRQKIPIMPPPREENIWVSESINVTSRTAPRLDFGPPGLATADSALLHWWLEHKTATTAIRYRVIASEKKLEIWPDSGFWNRGSTVETPSQLVPLVTVHALPMPTFVFPPPPESSSPSSMYIPRLILMAFIVPVTYILATLPWILFEALTLFLKVAAVALAVYAFIPGPWWRRDGRPTSLTELVQTVSNVVRNACRRTEPTVATGDVDLEAARSPKPALDVSTLSADKTSVPS